MLFSAYRRRVDQAATETPPDRDRAVDLWRVVALAFVVFGHWISASIWVEADGTIRALNTLQWIPGAEYWTWLFQVMPIFFLVGGYANAKSLQRLTPTAIEPPPLGTPSTAVADGRPIVGSDANTKALRGEGVDARRWIVRRARRLYTPVVPLILMWVLLVLALRPYIPPNVLYTGTLSATIPLWFIAVYLAVIALAPITHAWWQRTGPITVLVLALAAVSVDIARFSLDIEAIGWANYIFVWAFLHQLGYWWADRAPGDLGTSPTTGWLLVAAGLGSLVLTTTLGWYPVAMVTIPGGGLTNMIPPTFANGLLGIAQAGLILGTLGVAHRVASRGAVWRTVVAVSGSMMTIYLWHLTALSLLGAAGIFLFDGLLFSFEPGSVTWWIMRVPFFIGLAGVTLGLIAIFGRFEYSISDSPRPRSWGATVIGLVLAIGAASAMAFIGIVDQEGNIAWVTPLIALAGAMMLGAVPPRWARQSKIEEKPGPSGSFN